MLTCMIMKEDSALLPGDNNSKLYFNDSNKLFRFRIRNEGNIKDIVKRTCVYLRYYNVAYLMEF